MWRESRRCAERVSRSALSTLLASASACACAPAHKKRAGNPTLIANCCAQKTLAKLLIAAHKKRACNPPLIARGRTPVPKLQTPHGLCP